MIDGASALDQVLRLRAWGNTGVLIRWEPTHVGTRAMIKRICRLMHRSGLPAEDVSAFQGAMLGSLISTPSR